MQRNTDKLLPFNRSLADAGRAICNKEAQPLVYYATAVNGESVLAGDQSGILKMYATSEVFMTPKSLASDGNPIYIGSAPTPHQLKIPIGTTLQRFFAGGVIDTLQRFFAGGVIDTLHRQRDTFREEYLDECRKTDRLSKEIVALRAEVEQEKSRVASLSKENADLMTQIATLTKVGKASTKPRATRKPKVDNGGL